MALPSIMRKLFRNDGYGPLLKPEIIPFASDLASNASDVAASTEWVRDLAAAPVYVDASMASSGDGFTAATAVKTINEALNIVTNSIKPAIGISKIFVAGGTYTENIVLSSDSKISIELLGNVTLNGFVIIDVNSSLYLSGSSYTLTVNSGANKCFQVQNNSTVIIRCGLNLATSVSAIFIESFSCVLCYSAITVTADNATYVFNIESHSLFYCFSDITINGSGNTSGIYIATGGSVILLGDFSSQNNFINALWIEGGRLSCYNSTVTLKANSYSIVCNYFSSVQFLNCTVNMTSTDVNVFSTRASIVGFVRCTISAGLPSGGDYQIGCFDNSVVFFEASSECTFLGSGNVCIQAERGGCVFKTPNVSFPVGGFSGKRYSVNTNGVISVGGGANTIPGTSAGTTANGGVYV